MLVTLALAFSLFQSTHVTAELVSSVAAVKVGEPFLVGVVLRTDPGWHVYWSNPGEKGAAVTVDWKLPEGWKASELMWPVPNRYSEGEATTFGYDGSTLLLAKINQGDNPKKMRFVIDATVKWTATGDSTVTGSADLHIDRSVNENTYEHPVWNDRLLKAEKAVPQKADGWTITASPIEGGYVLKSKPPITLPEQFGLPTFYSSIPDVLDASATQNFRRNEDGSFWLALKSSAKATKPSESLKGILVAPKGDPWKPGVTAILVDVPISKP